MAAGALLVYLGPWAAARAGKTAAAWARALLLPLFLVVVLRIAGGAPAVFLYGKF